MNSGIKVIIACLLAMLLLGGVYAFSVMDFNPFAGREVEEVVEVAIEREDRAEEAAMDMTMEVTEPIRLKMVADLRRALENAEIDEEGKVVLDAVVRNRYNEFCNTYWMLFMPNVDDYEFEYLGAAAWHMFFIWDGEFGRFPDQISAQQMEKSLQELYMNSGEQYTTIEHRAYTKYVRYENGYYSLVPQSYNDNTFAYNPVEIWIEKSINGMRVRATMDEYALDTKGHYQPEEQELILIRHAEEMGLSLDTVLMVLLESDRMDEFEVKRTMDIEFMIDNSDRPHIIRFDNGEETYRLD